MKPSEDLVEQVAEAIQDAYLNTTDRFDAMNEFRAAARAAIAVMTVKEKS